MKQDGHQSEIRGKINKGLDRSEKKASAGIQCPSLSQLRHEQMKYFKNNIEAWRYSSHL